MSFRVNELPCSNMPVDWLRWNGIYNIYIKYNTRRNVQKPTVGSLDDGKGGLGEILFPKFPPVFYHFFFFFFWCGLDCSGCPKSARASISQPDLICLSWKTRFARYCRPCRRRPTRQRIKRGGKSQDNNSPSTSEVPRRIHAEQRRALEPYLLALTLSYVAHR